MASFIADAVQVGTGCRVLDPACGDGVFLEAALARGCKEVWGVEADPHLADTARARVQHDPRAVVFCGDGLRCQNLHPSLSYGTLDAVIGNPPFSAGPGRVTDRSLLAGFHLGAGARKGTGRPIEVLFVEQFIRLTRPGGRIGIILPEGMLANDRHQPVRRWILDHTELLAVVSLPRSAFRGTGTTARTVVLIAVRREGSSHLHTPLMADLSHLERRGPEALHHSLADVLRELHSAPPRAPKTFTTIPPPGDRVFRPDLEMERAGNVHPLQHRLDPGYWSPRFAPALRDLFACRFPLRPLGDFVEHMTYGPIVTDETDSPAFHSLCARPVLRVTQRQLLHSGLDLTTASAFPENSPWDCPRARIRAGDLLIARSGEKGLRAGKMVLVGALPDHISAVVGCFVDLVRLRGIEPAAVLAFLKGAYGQAQIQRLTSGVGAPNISFRELRSVLVPVLPPDQQRICRSLWEEAHSLHLEALCLPPGPERDSTLRRACEAMDELVGFVHKLVLGRKPA